MPIFVSSSQAAPLFDEIRALRCRPGLCFGAPLTDEFRDRVLRPDDDELLGTPVTAPEMAAAARAGLLVWSDHMEAAHELSQELTTPEGSYWHAIIHRREPDYANARYWFRRVGQHAVFPELAAGAARLDSWVQGRVRGGRWDPFLLIDLCEKAVNLRDGDPTRTALEDLQRLEIELLLAHCVRGATVTGAR